MGLIERLGLRNKAGLFLEETKLGAFTLFVDLFAELFEFFVFGVAFLLGFPDVFDVAEAPSVPSLLV